MTQAANLIYAPDPIHTPAWQCGTENEFVAADFRVDGLNKVLIVAVRALDLGWEEVERTTVAAEDAAGYAADLMSDLRGMLHDDEIYGWETGDLAASISAVIDEKMTAVNPK